MTNVAVRRLPKPVVGRGMPLRAMVQLDASGNRSQKVTLVLHRVDDPSVPEILIPFGQAPHREDRYLIDVPAASVAHGCYEGEILVGEDRCNLDTNIWII